MMLMRSICSLKYKLIKANFGCKASSVKANFGCKASSNKGLVNKDVLFFSISVYVSFLFFYKTMRYFYIYIFHIIINNFFFNIYIRRFPRRTHFCGVTFLGVPVSETRKLFHVSCNLAQFSRKLGKMGALEGLSFQ